jgi:hypothetical protein
VGARLPLSRSKSGLVYYSTFKRKSGLFYCFQEVTVGLFTTFKRESGLVYYFQEEKWAFSLLSRGKVGFFTTVKK